MPASSTARKVAEGMPSWKKRRAIEVVLKTHRPILTIKDNVYTIEAWLVEDPTWRERIVNPNQCRVKVDHTKRKAVLEPKARARRKAKGA